MIRFSAFLVVIAMGLLVAGGVTSKLLLVYLAIALSVVALIFLIVGAILHRREFRARPSGETAGTAAGGDTQDAGAESAALAGATSASAALAGRGGLAAATGKPPWPAQTQHLAAAQPAESGAGDSRPAESGAAKPGAAKPGPADAQPADAQPADAQPAEPQPAEPQPAEPQPAEPGPREPESAKPEPAEREPGKPVRAEPEPSDQAVTVVPAVPRYHRSDCILIRFMGDNDLQKMPVEAARETGCTPCRACQPDGEDVD